MKKILVFALMSVWLSSFASQTEPGVVPKPEPTVTAEPVVTAAPTSIKCGDQDLPDNAVCVKNETGKELAWATTNKSDGPYKSGRQFVVPLENGPRKGFINFENTEDRSAKLCEIKTDAPKMYTATYTNETISIKTDGGTEACNTYKYSCPKGGTLEEKLCSVGTPICPSGSTLNDNRCEQPAFCEYNTDTLSERGCAPKGIKPLCQQPGSSFRGGTCVLDCPQQTETKDYPTYCAPINGQCPEGTTISKNDERDFCVIKTCPEGSTINSFGACTYKPTCPTVAGQKPLKYYTGRCSRDSQCPNEQFVTRGKKCFSRATCPEGTRAEEGKCVYDAV